MQLTRNVPYAASATLDVFAPARPRGRPAPIVVTLHGCCGTGTDLFQLAYGLAASGAVVFNTTYRNLPEGGGYPVAYEQAACAVAFARARGGSYGGDPRRVTLVGWSDGALVAGVVANAARGAGTGPAPDCAVGSTDAGGPVAGADAFADAFVAVGGFLGWPVGRDGSVDPADVTDGTVRWFGGQPDAVPAAWVAGNPYTGLGRNPRLAIRLVVGRDDDLLAGNQRFLEAARAEGLDATLTIAEEAGDQTVVATALPYSAIFAPLAALARQALLVIAPLIGLGIALMTRSANSISSRVGPPKAVPRCSCCSSAATMGAARWPRMCGP